MSIKQKHRLLTIAQGLIIGFMLAVFYIYIVTGRAYLKSVFMVLTACLIITQGTKFNLKTLTDRKDQ